MKTKITFIIAILIGAICVAQQGINYKALIKDDVGNIIADTGVVVLFTIYEGDALTNDVYIEQHAHTTDANGFIILNIGTGNTGGNFNAINWGVDEHFLNVQVNVDGAGLIDLGTTQFMTVPYAIYAANVSGIEKITENNNTGWRLKGSDPLNYNDIGSQAIDLSHSTLPSNILGASGFASFASGNQTEASGINSVAMGDGTIASASSSMAVGSYNRDVPDAQFIVGNGTASNNKLNAITILKNGKIGLGNVIAPDEQIHLNGRIKIRDAIISSNALGDFVISNENLQKLGHYTASNEWGTANNNSLSLGSTGFRWSEIWSVNSLNTSSDRRLKKDINPINYGLDAVMNLKPVSYKWKQGKQGTKLGFIAQDVVSVVPEIIKLEKTTAAKKAQLIQEGRQAPKEDYYAMSYTELIPVLVKATQEQQNLIEYQQKQIDELKTLVLATMNKN